MCGLIQRGWLSPLFQEGNEEHFTSFGEGKDRHYLCRSIGSYGGFDGLITESAVLKADATWNAIKLTNEPTKLKEGWIKEDDKLLDVDIREIWVDHPDYPERLRGEWMDTVKVVRGNILHISIKTRKHGTIQLQANLESGDVSTTTERSPDGRVIIWGFEIGFIRGTRKK